MLIVCMPVHDKRPRKLAKGNIQGNFYLSELKDLKSFDLKILILTISRLSQILLHVAYSSLASSKVCVPFLNTLMYQSTLYVQSTFHFHPGQ